MAPSFDCAIASLLCSEENDSIFGNDEYGGASELNHEVRIENLSFNGDLFTGLPLQNDECLALMVEKECQYLPATDYLNRLKNGDLDLEFRKEAIDWIEKVRAHFSFGPLCAYLSINYMDRFLSAYELPKGNGWMMQLLAVVCLSLAAKIEESEAPLSVDLQVCESKYVFEARTIQRLELLVLNTLKWRMQAVTPFSYIDYFLHKISDDQNPSKSAVCQSSQLILSTIKGIDFLEFRPSEVAAAVAISVLGETQTVNTEKAIPFPIQDVGKERVLKCVELIHDHSLISEFLTEGATSSVQSAPLSPIGVLDAACLSYKSDESTVGSSANSSPISPKTKRRKLTTL